jgi:hypothetical protein
MSCCGKMRQQYRGAAGAPKAEPGAAAGRQFVVRFEYIGATSLVAVGPVSGRRYQFAHPGAQLAIDPRDRPGLSRIPKLRQVGS